MVLFHLQVLLFLDQDNILHWVLRYYLKDGFEHELKREIIAIATDKKHLTYLECKYQFMLGVLESRSYLNDNILGKFFDKDFV